MESDIPSSYSDQQLQIYKQLWESMNESADMFREQTMMFALYTRGFLLLAGYVVLIYIYYKDIKPMVELQKFSKEIAKGNLEIPLPITSNNGFVEFTESFDLMREELKSSKERELAAEHAKREMIAELSHDLKTPVATIQATCEVLEMKLNRKLNELERDATRYNSLDYNTADVTENISEIKDFLEKTGYISAKSETISQLVQNVFRANLDDMEEISVVPEETDSRKIQEYVSSLKEYGNVILDNDIPECLVYIDRLRMSQVIDNVVGNSYKYAGTDIHVSFSEIKDIPSKDRKKNSFIKVTIRDNGPGVPESELPLVIEKYYRGSDTKDKSGYGLGLYLVKWYMEKQGGGMEYYNDDGFVVELLVKKV
jgi:signal transduction histidine kinase